MNEIAVFSLLRHGRLLSGMHTNEEAMTPRTRKQWLLEEVTSSDTL
jgi:hypothetical protein